jgi:hypothetical protein
MNDFITVIVAGVEIMFLGSETILEFMADTEILGATLYAWFLGYLVLDTIISIFISNNEERLIEERVIETPTPEEDNDLDYELG